MKKQKKVVAAEVENKPVVKDWTLLWEYLGGSSFLLFKKKWWMIFLFPSQFFGDLVVLYYFGQLIGVVFQPNATWEMLGILIGQWLLIELFLQVMGWLYWRQEVLLVREMAVNSVRKVSEVIFYFDIKQYLDHRTGELFAKLTQMWEVEFPLIKDFIYIYLKAILSLVVVSIYLFFNVWQLGVWYVIFIFVFGILFWNLQSQIKKQQREISKEINKRQGDWQDKSSNLLLVKSQAQEENEIHKLVNWTRDISKSQLNLDHQWINGRIFLQVLKILMIFIAIGISFYLFQYANYSLSLMIPTMWVFWRASGDITSMVMNWQFQLRRVVSICEGQEIMRQEVLVKDLPGARKLQVKMGEVVFEKVNFDYEKKPAVRDFDLVLPAGKMTALVGHSGAGKSTLATLMLRFYDLKSGRILIDGQDIAKVTQRSLRQNIALVMQDNSLFHESLKFNIAYGVEKANQKMIEAAAKKAQIHDFIIGLKDKYETLVGQRGLRLSGGERQRIAIARAILKEAPVLVLDEATSALDSVNERKVQKALEEMMKGRTSLVIAHRLSTVKKADLIVVMEGGKIVEKGTHNSLVRKGGVYAKLVKEQVEGMIGE